MRVGAPFAGDLLTPVFGRFMAAYPEIELDLDYNDRLVDVIEDGFDAVIRTGEVSDSRLKHVKLGDFTFRLVAAPSYLDRMGAPTDASDLARHRLLHHRFYETGKLGAWSPVVPEGAVLPISLAATSLEPLVSLAEAGCGVAYVPSFALGTRLRDGRLVEVLPDTEKRGSALRLLWPVSKAPLPKLSAFVKFVTDEVRSALIDGER